jgi:hypothetical protein
LAIEVGGVEDSYAKINGQRQEVMRCPPRPL